MREDSTLDRRSFLKATGAGVVLLTTGQTTTFADESDLQAKALEHAASESGASEDDLSIVNETTASYSTLGERYYHVKVRNDAESETNRVMLDGDGSLVEPVELDRRERAAYERTYGKLGPELHDVVSTGSADDRIDVDVWTEPIDRAAARRAVGIENRPDDAAAKQELAEEFQRRIRDRTEGVATAIESIADATNVNPATNAHYVEVTATPSALDAIERVGKVRRVLKRSTAEDVPDLSEASETQGSYGQRNGDYNASGYPIGIFEASGHPDNPDVVNLEDIYESSLNDVDHAGKVAACAASTDDDEPGMAHDAPVYASYTASSDGSEDDKISWFDTNTLVVNCSWTAGGDSGDRTMISRDVRYSDYVLNNYLNIAHSAGNESSGNYVVTSPGKTFNVVTVGSIDDQNTGGDQSDDEWADHSRYQDPQSKNADGDNDYYPLDKPEVSAVGDRIQTPNMWGETSGTSFATPHASGLVALLCKFGDDNGTLSFEVFPELVKPILMASATNQGDSSYDFDKMGPGAVYAPHVEDIVSYDWFEGDTFDSSNDTQTYEFYASQYNDTVRVALSWLTDINDANWSDLEDVQSDLDLDLRIQDPDGNFRGSSVSFDSGWEYIEFEPDTSGYYTIEVENYRWDSSDSSRYIGLAWHRN
jgi:hypothetical protein